MNKGSGAIKASPGIPGTAAPPAIVLEITETHQVESSAGFSSVAGTITKKREIAARFIGQDELLELEVSALAQAVQAAKVERAPERRARYASHLRRAAILEAAAGISSTGISSEEFDRLFRRYAKAAHLPQPFALLAKFVRDLADEGGPSDAAA